MPDRIDTDLQFDHLVVELEAGVPQGGEVFAVVGGMRREIVDIEVEFAEDTDCGSGADVVINLQTGDPDDADPLSTPTSWRASAACSRARRKSSWTTTAPARPSPAPCS